MKRLYRSAAVVVSFVVVLVGTALGAGGSSVVSQSNPFAACLGIGADSFGGINFPDTEVEPWVASNPANSQNIVGSFQQDRWSDGGSKGLVAAWTLDGGKTWGETPLPFSTCAAAANRGAVLPYDRATDPWNSIGPDGKSYAVSASFNANDNNNAVGAATSSDGGRTWRNLRSIITDVDSDPAFPFNDKESVTADPLHAGYAYVVWDRLENISCGPSGQRPSRPPVAPERPVRASRAAPAQLDCYDGPTYFSRTTDGGQTWSAPSVIVPTPVNEQTIGNVIVVDHQTDVLYDFFTYIDASNNLFVAMVHTLGPGNGSSLAWSAPVVIELEDVTVGVVDPRNSDPLRTGSILPEPAIDPVSGQLYVVWEDARFNGDYNDQVVISTSPRGGGAWTAAALVSPPGEVAAFTPSVAVNGRGQVGVAYYTLNESLNWLPQSVLPTDYWFTRANGGPSPQFTHRQHLAGPFNHKAAPFAGGFFLGDYQGLTTSPGDRGFLAFFEKTNCNDPSCVAIGTPNGAGVRPRDPTDTIAAVIDFR